MSAPSLSDAVGATLDVLELAEEDAGAAALARRLAQTIEVEDSGRTVAELAGKLLAVLESLGATPAARKALLKGVHQGDGGKQRSKLDELRAKREARAREQHS